MKMADLLKVSKHGLIITNFNKGAGVYLETKTSQNLSHIPCVLYE